MIDSAGLHTLSAEWMLLPNGWHQHMELSIDKDGLIVSVGPAITPPDLPICIPGMINLHSHAFQRHLVGRTQRFSRPEDDFWSWRSRMYSEAAALTTDSQFKGAQRLYADMLSHGYTTVCEFHYTHGAVQRDNAEIPVLMAESLLRASESTGMRMMLLPVLYQQAGFGEQPLAPEQRSFGLDTQVYLRLIEHLRDESPRSPLQSIGYAPHSLRAVGLDSIRAVIDHRADTAPHAPVHIHIAEQVREVNECILAHRKRPVEWLLDAFEPDSSWCLIHATHMSDPERRQLIERQITVGLCPTTEADLGDGFFPLSRFISEGGTWGIGSDSNLCVDPFQEIRLMDWQQRLSSRRRNAFKMDALLSVATRLYLQACEGGRRASGMAVGRIEEGSSADLVVLSDHHPLLDARTPDDALAACMYSGDKSVISQVYTSGRPRLQTT
ncbi:MAG: formimidoylglutamate deiminase [Bacteroidetes bacterium]|nr:formimidoylglutamate deiminase [Bacteroidota bacterium]MDA1334095.1 formimidoylglutamate deiminase [Bacteroidota bacterium]